VTTLMQYFVFAPFQDDLKWLNTMGYNYDERYRHAVWFSLAFPYVMIALFYFTTKKEPNQPPGPTR
jgi:hypothetical protein